MNFLIFYEPLRNGLFPRFPKDMLALSASRHSVPCSYFLLLLFCSHGLPVQFRVPVQVMPLLYSFISPSNVTRQIDFFLVN